MNVVIFVVVDDDVNVVVDDDVNVVVDDDVNVVVDDDVNVVVVVVDDDVNVVVDDDVNVVVVVDDDVNVVVDDDVNVVVDDDVNVVVDDDVNVAVVVNVNFSDDGDVDVVDVEFVDVDITVDDVDVDVVDVTVDDVDVTVDDVDVNDFVRVFTFPCDLIQLVTPSTLFHWPSCHSTTLLFAGSHELKAFPNNKLVCTNFLNKSGFLFKLTGIYVHSFPRSRLHLYYIRHPSTQQYMDGYIQLFLYLFAHIFNFHLLLCFLINLCISI